MRTLFEAVSEVFFGRMEGSFVLLLLLFVLAIISFTYVLSFMCSNASKAQVVIGGVYTTLFLFLAVAALFDSFRWAMDQTKSVKQAGLHPLYDYLVDYVPSWVWVLISVGYIIPIHPWLCGMMRLLANNAESPSSEVSRKRAWSARLCSRSSQTSMSRGP